MGVLPFHRACFPLAAAFIYFCFPSTIPEADFVATNDEL
jgi:hypothetical protein